MNTVLWGFAIFGMLSVGLSVGVVVLLYISAKSDPDDAAEIDGGLNGGEKDCVLTVCSHCKRIIKLGRTINGLASHGICPRCKDALLKELHIDPKKWL